MNRQPILRSVVLGMMFVAWAAMSLSSCHYYKEKDSEKAKDLIENIDHFNIDTIVAKDTLCSPVVDSVLRHYPELYHAAKKAKKAYINWAEDEKAAKLGTKTDDFDVNAILDYTLYGDDELAEVPEWPDLAPTDTAYLKLIGLAHGKHQSNIGHARRAWMTYQERLKQMVTTVPEECRGRYISTIAARIQKHCSVLKQKDNEKK